MGKHHAGYRFKFHQLFSFCKQVPPAMTTQSIVGKLKQKIFAHIETMRLYTVIWCGLVSLVGASLAYGNNLSFTIDQEIRLFLSFLIPILGWIAALYLSDFLDRKLDAIQKPHRPIPSGRIKPKEALGVGGIYVIVGFLLCFLLSPWNVLLVFVVAALVFAYSKISKSRGIFGNINRGIVIIAAYVFGVFATGISPESIPLSIWLLSIVFLIHDITSNLVGTIRDREGDQKGGYNTIPVKYGVKTSFTIAACLSSLCILLIIGFIVFSPLIRYLDRFIIVFACAVLILCIMYLRMFTAREIDRVRALQAHEFFVAERVTLASAFLFGVISSWWIAALIFTVSLGLALSTQRLLRKRYEFVRET
ncbi:MAG: UbiA family prenyltransferase [Euryarchaeota archaeon]|nr:UbiA family prenyltransferase [Euryarchaeota archaeon]